MPLEPGTVLSHYRLDCIIGEGGMGVVWKASDTHLNREVALKVLPEAFSQDQERLSRFQREARLLAALNHGHIAAIHGLDEADGIRFLVMELVSGEGLDRRLAREPMSVERALKVALQVSEALEAAHEQGIIHRDLKPANIMLAADGKVKVLDFGLAKAMSPAISAASGSDISSTPTMTSGGTRQGMILGTAAYMSPEQARGRDLDRRCDIWAFGCLLYECLTGKRAFGGETISDSLAAVLRAEPDLDALPATTPSRIRHLLHRCLIKDPLNRLRDVGDARLDLQQAIAGKEWQKQAEAPATAEQPGSSRYTRLAMMAAGIAIGALLWGALGWWLQTPAPPEPALRLSVSVPEGIVPSLPRLTPDGQTLVYIGAQQGLQAGQTAVIRLFIRPLSEETATAVPASEGIIDYDLSPDGTRIAFVAPTSTQSTRLQIFHIPLDLSAPPLAIRDWAADYSTDGFLWLDDAHLATTTKSPLALVRIPVDGSPLPPPLTIQAEDTLEPFPMLRIPGTNAILCRVSTWGEKGYQETVQVLDLTTGEMTLLVENAQRASLLPDGRLLVSRHDTLLAIPFDRQTLSITGGPQPVASGLRAENTWQGAWFDLSDNGTLVHLPGGLIGPERRLVYLQDGTRALPWSEERRSYNVRVTASRDGSRFAVIVANATQLYEVWVADLDTPRLKRFVSEPGQDCYPAAWTADNQRLVYYCLGDPKGQGIFIKPLDGSAPAETILRDDRTVFMGLVAQALAPDGETLIVMRQEKTGRVPYSVSMAVDAQGERPLQPLEGMAQAQEISFSPDGKWLAYISDISGRNQAYVRRYHPGSHLGPENPITSQGASDVEWARGTDNGGLRLLVTRPGAGRTFAIDMTAEPRLRFSQPELVLEPALLNPGFVSMTDLPDGRWFGIQQGPNEGDTDSISLVLNWRQDMMRRSAGE